MTLLSLNSASDLLAKCNKELHELKDCEEHPEYDFTLFNIVLELNHLFEWYLKDNSINQDKIVACIEKFNPFHSPHDVSGDFKKYYKKLKSFPNTNEYQEIIRKLCNKAKHFKKQPIEKQHKIM